jgi:hypothetical protein
MIQNYTSNDQQTLFDVALMQYGGLQGLGVLLQENQSLLLGNGRIDQFSSNHKIRKNHSVDNKIKARMLTYIPCTGNELEGAYLIDDELDGLIDDQNTQITDN